MIGSLGQGAIAKRLAQSDQARDACSIIASLEREQLEAAQVLADAAGLDEDISPPSVEERRDALLDLIQAVVGGEFGEFWRTEVATDVLDSEPPEYHMGLGRDSEEWAEQVEEWAELVREQGGSGPDRALADALAQDRFGVSLDQYETLVVDYEMIQEARHLFAGNFRATTHIMRRAASTLRDEEEEEGEA